MNNVIVWIVKLIQGRPFSSKSGTESGTEKENPLKISGLLWCWELKNLSHFPGATVYKKFIFSESCVIKNNGVSLCVEKSEITRKSKVG